MEVLIPADPKEISLDPRTTGARVRDTLIARRAGEVLHFDIRLQGEGETAFFAL